VHLSQYPSLFPARSPDRGRRAAALVVSAEAARVRQARHSVTAALRWWGWVGRNRTSTSLASDGRLMEGVIENGSPSR
jgi:hypothetical protein